jgi:hypothetical protein
MRLVTLAMLRTSVEAPPGVTDHGGTTFARLWRNCSARLVPLAYSHSIVPGGFDVMS